MPPAHLRESPSRQAEQDMRRAQVLQVHRDAMMRWANAATAQDVVDIGTTCEPEEPDGEPEEKVDEEDP